MDDKQVLYYARNENVPRYLNAKLQPHGYELVKYEIGAEIDQETSIFILFSPVKCNDRYVSCDASWKQYFQKKNADIRFITVGFAKAPQDEDAQKNYMDLLKLPADFDAFFAAALKASGDWTPAYTGGIDMQEKLQRFFEGHGMDSVDQVFSSVKANINFIDGRLKRGYKLETICREYSGFPIFIERWTIFRNRFSNYYPFFKCLPFFSLLEKIYNLTEKIDPFFQSGNQVEALYRELKVSERILEIHELFKDGEKYLA